MYYAYYFEHAMRRATAHEANQRFSEILWAFETGEQVVITKRGRPVALMSPYPAEALAAERQAAIDRMIAAMNEPITLRGGFRTSPATKCTSADELHVRHQHPGLHIGATRRCQTSARTKPDNSRGSPPNGRAVAAVAGEVQLRRDAQIRGQRRFGAATHKRLVRGFPVQPAAEPDLAAALDLVSAHNISFWDALLCATAIRMGLSFLMTEDLQDGRSLHGLTIVNPFRPDNDALVDHILPP
jgi:prevent-host-death family protein